MAVGDAYGAKEWREGDGEDEVAFRTMKIERRSAARSPSSPSATPSGRGQGLRRSSTPSAPCTRACSRRWTRPPSGIPTSVYEPQLIDATFALLISSAGEALVIPALNRDGDILSDLVLPLFGSIAGSESLLVGFNEDYTPRALMAEAAHGPRRPCSARTSPTRSR